MPGLYSDPSAAGGSGMALTSPPQISPQMLMMLMSRMQGANGGNPAMVGQGGLPMMPGMGPPPPNMAAGTPMGPIPGTPPGGPGMAPSTTAPGSPPAGAATLLDQYMGGARGATPFGMPNTASGLMQQYMGGQRNGAPMGPTIPPATGAMIGGGANGMPGAIVPPPTSMPAIPGASQAGMTSGTGNPLLQKLMGMTPAQIQGWLNSMGGGLQGAAGIPAENGIGG